MIQFIAVGVLIMVGFFLLFSQEIKFSLSQKEALNKVLDDINKAPDFTLKAMNDSVYVLSELDGKVVLINFWATWCGPCRMEIPEFNEMHKNYHEKGLEILGVSISDNKKQLNNFAKSFVVDYPLLYGSTREMNKIMKDYGGVNAVPSSFLVGITMLNFILLCSCYLDFSTLLNLFPLAIMKKTLRIALELLWMTFVQDYML